MISLDFHPEPGSPTARVLDLMARNPEDGYSNSDLALKFQVKSAAWPPLLAKAKAMGLVAYTAQGEDEPKVWCAGPNLAAWMAARSATPATGGTAAPSQAATQERKCGGTRPLLPALDLATLKVDYGVPVAPRRIGKPGDSRWTPVLDLLTKPGDSLPLPMPYKAAVYAHIKKATKAGRLQGTYIVRPCSLEIGKCRVHRTA